MLLDEGWPTRTSSRERATGLGELRELLGDYPPERVEDISGVPADDLAAAARLYGSAEQPAIVYGLGVTEHAHGTDGVRTLANLAILTGAVGTAGRRRRDPAARPEQRPGRVRHGRAARPPARLPEVTDAAVRARFEAAGACGSRRGPGCGSRDVRRRVEGR